MRNAIDLAHLPPRTPTRFLRSELGLQGLLVSDDLLMKGMLPRSSSEEASLLALPARVDLLLLSHNTAAQDRSTT